MSILSQEPPRPRSNAPSPGYPAILGVGMMLAATCCGGVSASEARAPRAPERSDEAPAQVLVVSAVSPVQSGTPVIANEPAPAAPPFDLLAGVAPPKFPEDDLSSNMSVGCGGGCPPAYVLETGSRDSGQLRARLRYCQKAGRKHLPDMSGTMSVRAHIDVGGQARQVVVDATGDIPPPVASCVQRLVETAAFSSKYNYERDAQESIEIKSIESVEESPQ